MYRAESWVTYRRHLRLIKRYHKRCICTILNILWNDFVNYIEAMKWQWSLASIPCYLKHSFAEQNMSPTWKINHRTPKIVLYGELSTGNRDRGAPRKRYKGTLKRSFDTCYIDHRQWTTTHATNRMNWRPTVYQATTSFEITQRTNREDNKKGEETSEINIEQTVTCSRSGNTIFDSFHQPSACLH